MNVMASFLITAIAGFATMLGTFTIFLKYNHKIISSALLFASGVMIIVSIIDLIPESFLCLSNILYTVPAILCLLIFFVIGFISAFLINDKIPNNQNSLYRVGLISMIAIIMHNIPEGIATFMSSNNNINIGIVLSIAIALHNIPEGISIATPIYYATNDRKKALFYTFISSLSEIFGAIIAYVFLYQYINDFTLGILYSFIAGIMIYISIFELIFEARKEQNCQNIYLIIGAIFMLISHLLLK